MADSGFIQKLGIPLEEISKTKPQDIWPVKFEKHGLKRVLDSDVHKEKLVMYTAIRDPISRLISAYKDKIGKKSKIRFIFKIKTGCWIMRRRQNSTFLNLHIFKKAVKKNV